MCREVREDPDTRGAGIITAERRFYYPEVSRLVRVIDSDTITAVIDEELVRRIESGEKVSWRDVQEASVQIWRNKLMSLPVRPVRGRDELMA